MGNICSFSIPLDQSVDKVSQWLGEKGSYIYNLEKNLDALTTAMEKLKAKQDDLLRRLTREEDRGRKRLAEFQVWLDSVETIEKQISDILIDRNVQSQRLCLCGFCSKSLRSSYRYGKIVFLTLREVEKLRSEYFEEISAESYEVEERQLPSIIVGQEMMVDKAWTHLMKDEVGIMGLYGMGGVGKTTLLTQINNKFTKDRCGFDYVIWVVVSKELRIEKIQDEIAQIIGLDRFRWDGKSKSQKTNKLFNFLRKKKFVLILDDIWEKVELRQIGVPLPKRENECKVAFTTRSREVCTRMGIEDPMEVQCLTENDAFDLFQKKVGQETLDSDSDIPDLAIKVARKCCGLPLALDVIGETMSSKTSVQEWRYAVEVLTSNAANFADMEDKILPLLKYSYDDIKDEQVQSCLLYCSLFPEDARMNKKDLIEYWIGEGIINGSECIETAENKGYEIIGSLVRASLLMKEHVMNGRHVDSIEMVYTHDFGSKMVDGIEMVYMHDVVREMALWVASDLGLQKETFIVRAGVGLRKIPKVNNWSVVRRMSLMNNEIRCLIGSPKCMKLTTLLLQSTHLSKISNEFFKSMPMLVALDLSKNDSITKLPEGISALVSLQYLNLSGTSIPRLPLGLQSVKKLIHLDLERTRHLSSIAVVSSLLNLKVLKLSGSGFLWDLNTVKKLETLKHLDILTISIDGSPGPKHFLRSRRLASHTRELFIWTSEREPSHTIFPVKMDKLCHLYIEGSEEITMGRTCSFLSLVKVEIKCCHSVRELTFLMFAPSLKYLDVSKSEELEDIINKEKASECEISGIVPFPKLTEIYLNDLPKLENIYWSPLPFSCLKIFKVTYCPNLIKLPLDSKSGKHGRLIIDYDTDDEWIEGVQWEDEATKTRFLAS